MNFLETYEIEYKYINAASLCKAKQDVRFYLCGVYFGNGFIASTNGHIAFIHESEKLSGLDIIIPSEPIDSLVKKIGKKPLLKNVLLHKLDDGFWLFDHNGSYELFKPIDGKYPDIKRIDIKKPNKIEFKDYPKFDFVYLNVFLKVNLILGNKLSPIIYPTTENDRAYVELDDKSHGLLMPRRI